MKCPIILSMLLLTSGCIWPVVNVPPGPSAMGTWTGVTEPVKLYRKDGALYEAMGLKLASGPALKYPDGRLYEPGVDSVPVLLDENRRPIQIPAGQSVEVS